MGKNAHTKCREIVDVIKKSGFDKQVPANELLKIIKVKVGGDLRTVSKYVQLMVEFGFVAKTNAYVYEILTEEKQ